MKEEKRPQREEAELEVDVSRFTDWGEHIIPIENENLQCIDCIHLIGGDVASCRKYKVKPHDVLAGKPVCKYFQAKPEK